MDGLLNFLARAEKKSVLCSVSSVSGHSLLASPLPWVPHQTVVWHARSSHAVAVARHNSPVSSHILGNIYNRHSQVVRGNSEAVCCSCFFCTRQNFIIICRCIFEWWGGTKGISSLLKHLFNFLSLSSGSLCLRWLSRLKYFAPFSLFLLVNESDARSVVPAAKVQMKTFQDILSVGHQVKSSWAGQGFGGSH